MASLFVLFWLAKSIFTILAWLAPALLIAAVIIDYNTVLNYGKWLVNQLRFNTLNGILFTLLTVFGFPVVTLFLFGKSLFRKKMKALEKDYREQKEGMYTDYEIVDEEVEPLELPPLERRKSSTQDDYEQLFD